MDCSDLLSIGLRIKNLREKKGHTQEDMAKSINIERGKLAKWERGLQDFKTQDIVMLSRFFSVSADYLLGLSDGTDIDDDVKAISRYTSLSSNAIKSLKENLVPEKIRPLEEKFIASDILSNNNFYLLLGHMKHYIDACVVQETFNAIAPGLEQDYEEINFGERQCLINSLKEFAKISTEFLYEIPDMCSINDVKGYYQTFCYSVRDDVDLQEFRINKDFREIIKSFKDKSLKFNVEDGLNTFIDIMYENGASEALIEKFRKGFIKHID